MTTSVLSKRSTSKYDFVKVRVHLSRQHYYVLSRFLLCRMLMATKIPLVHATRIALDLKKRLVDRGALNISQMDLEEALFQLMAAHGYGQRNVRLFRTLNRLHHQRIPMVVLIGGARCVGKSTLATQLSERLNLANTIQTDLICDMARSLLGAPRADHKPLSEPDAAARAQECAMVQQALEIELRKCLSSGKSVIVEGAHVDAALYDSVLRLLEEERTRRAVSAATVEPASLQPQQYCEATLVPSDLVLSAPVKKMSGDGSLDLPGDADFDWILDETRDALKGLPAADRQHNMIHCRSHHNAQRHAKNSLRHITRPVSDTAPPGSIQPLMSLFANNRMYSGLDDPVVRCKSPIEHEDDAHDEYQHDSAGSSPADHASDAHGFPWTLDQIHLTSELESALSSHIAAPDAMQTSCSSNREANDSNSTDSNSDVLSNIDHWNAEAYIDTDTDGAYASSASSGWGEDTSPAGIVVPFLLTVPEPAFHRELVEDTCAGDALCTATIASEMANARAQQHALAVENQRRPPARQFIPLSIDRTGARSILERMHEAVLARVADAL
ncbi:hypothetical protein THASP1DRAFT_31806 [Thamnocephalis sphaerospora]|uniref:Zeta toxin domain-containing protein n=1 Tax=Thamnocephalis sphaerospora TaxID=78915 RepID=A0A4P9XM96_9FUNG|nr:hypothetical protein THASP1DRAFT_31806 [Thamnocephalis sphaerospora]|eukprot:RKP06370.1 hypothetical protein THASP1DRAFT_31806 [Thamnocephalis sphaerospora]